MFFQNGMVEAWLERKGLKDANQVLAYFAVSKIGEAPVDGRTDTNPEGLTAAYGNWASAVASRLKAGGLSCKVYITSYIYFFFFCIVVCIMDSDVSNFNFRNLFVFFSNSQYCYDSTSKNWD